MNWVEQQITDPHWTDPYTGDTVNGLVAVRDGLTFHLYELPSCRTHPLSRVRLYAYIGESCVADLRHRMDLGCTLADAMKTAEEFDGVAFLLAHVEEHQRRLDKAIMDCKKAHASCGMYAGALSVALSDAPAMQGDRPLQSAKTV